jgi:hypothetical protein
MGSKAAQLVGASGPLPHADTSGWAVAMCFARKAFGRQP